ncbi:MAG: hypothetical protein Q8936_07605 [Bacillota bacterium]|nr:hypothetical protein [Bacillota bacterium]
MKIAFINGSPKIKESASSYILEELKTFLEQDGNIISEFCFRQPQLTVEEMEQFTEYNVFVFAFPLYVDGIPSHLLNCLVQLETIFAAMNRRDIMVYSLVNCGFYEAHQNKLALEMMENWCAKAGLKWGQGLAIGGGGMLISIKSVPMGHGPKRNFEKAFKQLANNILKCASGENIFINQSFPRILYKLGAEMGWRQSIKANGLKRNDLFLKK